MEALGPWLVIVLLALGAIPIVAFFIYGRSVRLPEYAANAVPERLEFVIRPDPGEWLTLRPDQYEELFSPSSVPSSKVAGWGDHRIRAHDVEIAFTYENDTVQVAFEGRIEGSAAQRIAEEVRDRLSAATGLALHLVAL